MKMRNDISFEGSDVYARWPVLFFNAAGAEFGMPLAYTSSSWRNC
jgi:hypothetical protein